MPSSTAVTTAADCRLKVRTRNIKFWTAQDAWAAEGHQGEMTGKWQALFECTLLSPEMLVVAKQEKFRLLHASRLHHKERLETITAELMQLIGFPDWR